jgi:hypothetical protein
MKKKTTKSKKAKPRRVVKKKIVKKSNPTKRGSFSKAGKAIGVVTHYYGDIGVGIVRFKKTVLVGITVEFCGATTDFTQTIASMQYDHASIQRASKGKEIGIKVKKRVREGDEVFEIK